LALLCEYRGQHSKDNGGDAEDPRSRLCADVGPRDDAGALEALDVVAAVVVTVGEVSLQALLALGGSRIQGGTNLGNRVSILLIPFVLFANIAWLLARDAAGVDDGIFRVGKRRAVVDRLVEALGGGIAAGFIREGSEVDAPSVGGADYLMQRLKCQFLRTTIEGINSMV
jgi:hypothetical protein